MTALKYPIKLLIISAFVYLLGACGTAPHSQEDGVLDVVFTVDCVQLVCTLDTSDTFSDSDNVSSLLCDMGDGSQIDVLMPEVIFDYTYDAPDLYSVICNATNEDTGATDTAQRTVNVDGVLVNAGPDQTVSSGTTVTLDGSASEATVGSPINLYRWRNKYYNDPQLEIVGADTVNPTFLAPDENDTKTYQVTMRVSIDGGENFSDNTDYVDITVIPAGDSDLPQ